MRILHLTDRVTDRGGAHRHLLGVLEALVAAGHDVRLAAGADDGRVVPPCPVTRVAGLESRTRTPVALEPLLAEVRPHVVHVHTVVNPTALEGLAGRPALVTVQDHRAFCPAQGKWTAAGAPCREAMGETLCRGCFDEEGHFRQMLELTRERLDAISRLPLVVLSRYMAAELVGVGIAPERVTVIPPFVHGLTREAEPDGPPGVLFVGRLAAAKGVLDGVQAWRLAGLGLPLVVAGTGPLRTAVESAGVPVLGWLERGRLSRLYRSARAVLLPSRWQEPFGIAGLESLWMGVSVAAWDAGGVGEWHPGGEQLATWGDVGGLAAALRVAAASRPAFPEGFGREELMDRLVSLYRQVSC